MRVKVGATLFGLIFAVAALTAQGPPPAAQGGRRGGGFVPGQQRPPGDPAQIARGKTLYGISCTGCHGADLRGGDIGGPNLLRSQVALSDRNGELIIPIIQGSRKDSGMPAIDMSPADATAVAAYVRSVMETIGRQGMPPSIGKAAPSVLVGNAGEGQAYFAAKCASCHSADRRSARASRPESPIPKMLQNTWVAGGGGRGGRRRTRRRGRRVQRPHRDGRRSRCHRERRAEGRLVRIDDFLVTVALADGTMRTFRRDGDVPKVEVHDPMKAHRDLLAVYTDKDMHDVTAYLVTLK